MRMSISVVGLGALIVLAFVALGQYAPEDNQDLFERFAIVPAWITSGNQSPGDAAAALFGHVFFHYGFLHLLMNSLAFLQAAP
ncbi:MAG: hypothetical protein ABL883_05885, partial [Terricaulis sp.]